MPGTTVPTRLLDWCSQRAATLPTLMVSEGKRRLAESESLENMVRALPAQARGYLGVWIDECSQGNLTTPGEVTIAGLLVGRLPKDVTTDVTVLYDLAEAVSQLWGDESTLSAAGVPSRPLRITWRPTGDNLEDDVVGIEITARFSRQGCG